MEVIVGKKTEVKKSRDTVFYFEFNLFRTISYADADPYECFSDPGFGLYKSRNQF